jgi:hypothetical protein
MSSTEYVSIASIVIASSAVVVALLRFRKDKLKAQADLVSALAALVRHIDNDKAVEARGILRKDPVLNGMVGKELDDATMAGISEKTQEAARYIATTYDRLGFILKHDESLENEVLGWNGDVISDMWRLTGSLVKKKWRSRNPHYAKEFERLAQRAAEMGW